MKGTYVRFATQGQGGYAASGHGTVNGIQGSINDGTIPVGNHIYEYKGTVVEEETFKEVEEAFVPGRIYKDERGSNWYCCHVVAGGFMFQSGKVTENAQCLYWFFDNKGRCTVNNAKLTVGTKKVSTGKKKVLKVL